MLELVKKFNDNEDKRVLIGALEQQLLIRGDTEIATKLANLVVIETVRKNEAIITQDDATTDMFFILSGNLGIVKNGREVALRGKGHHVGEMAMIDIGQRRSASVIAKEDSIVAKVTETNFSVIAEQHPRLFREIGLTLAERLRQVTPQVKMQNEVPRIFIGSSKEALPFANELCEKLASEGYVATVWTEDVFRPSEFALESLENAARDFDFSAFVFHQDDIIFSRDKFIDGPRDNVVFETGLFIGATGRKRTFILCPGDIKVPSDLFGLNRVEYLPENEIGSRCDGAAKALIKEMRTLGSK